MRRVALLVLLLGRVESDAPRHHHCVHDEMARRLDEAVGADSRVVPQRLEPEEAPMTSARDAFRDAVGLGHRRTTTLASLARPVQPLRIAFDLSRLSSDPGRACTKEGELVKTDGGGVYRCAGSDVLTPAKRDFILTVLLKAVQDYFGSVLSVRRVAGNLVIKGLSCPQGDDWACCAGAVPKKLKTDGVANADFVLHVTARPTTGATIAWALPCNLDQFGRPISGQANFGPGRLDPLTPSARTEQVAAALHEMTHALVFSKGRFADFRQPLNGPKWGYSNVVSQSQGTGGIWVSMIITPNVVRQAKQQFNCFDWVNAGLELENGDSGSADFSSHWEKRLLMNEYMTATSSYDPVYSAMTLALFEDSGWYQVDYTSAQLLPWGYMEGCGVAQGRCSTWNTRYICSDPQQTACTADYTSKGYCNTASYTSSIPAGFQYFQDPTFGGRDAFSDYCPFYRAYSNGDCRGIGRVATAANTGNYIEEVGPNSRCFQSSLSRTSSDSAARRASCYRVLDCTPTGLRLSIGGKTVVCPLEGGEIQVSGFKGVLTCPPADNFCKLMRDKCSGNGILLSNGSCECTPGFVGDDCSGIKCPLNPVNGLECGGSKQGTCNNRTGRCKCSRPYTGLTCAELVCPVGENSKNASECSSHGKCDRAYGNCICNAGYSGKSCECVPGCSSSSCGSNGSCDCTTGGCSCDVGYSGVNCSELSNPTILELNDSMPTLTDTIADKAYKFYKIYLSASTFDITFSVRYKSNNGKGTDVDLYGSFIDMYPTSLSAKSSLFVSDFSVGDRDEINLCGSLGIFPRGVNDTFRHCARTTSSYLLETPGFFYVSVFGYAGGVFNLSILADKCKNVTCSNHGLCGVNYPGVCTCDRYWTGDDCSIPQCGPDCQDLGTCGPTPQSSSSASGSMSLTSSGSSGETIPPPILRANASLLRSTECYGHGVCRVDPDNDIPRCICEGAFTYVNPTSQQAMCKELLPTISTIQAFTEDFNFSTSDNNEVLDVNTWALFTIVVDDEWDTLSVTVEIHTDDADAMLAVSKAKLPSMLLMSAQQASYSIASSSTTESLEYMDLQGWMSNSLSRKVILSRASSTLTSGLYYIGISNSVYAQNPLAYDLDVQTTSICLANGNDSRVCSNGGSCNSTASQLCACTNGFFGQFCDYQYSSATLLPPLTETPEPSASPKVNDSNTTTAPSAPPGPRIAFQSSDVQTLGVGDWAYFSFGISDPTARVVRFQLTMENDHTNETPVFPLLLVRGPLDMGYPTLFTQNLQDFESVSRREPTQAIFLEVSGQCDATQSSGGCYKVSVFNRDYSTDVLRYRLEVVLHPSLDGIFPDSMCGIDEGVVSLCHGNGKCVMLPALNSSPDPVETTPLAPSAPTCVCKPSWTGMQCNSPKMFDAPHLWSEINATGELCDTCNTSFAFNDGDLRVFRVPANASSGSGLRLRLSAPATGEEPKAVTPIVYVSETIPRSMYDFTYISSENASLGGDQVVEIPPNTLSEFYWVVIFSGYPQTMESASLAQNRVTRHLGGQLTRAQASLVHSLASHQAEPTVTLVAEPLVSVGLPNDVAPLLPKTPAHSSAWRWLVHTTVGLATISATSAFVVALLCVFVYRRRKKPSRREDNTKDTSNPTATAGSDIELGTSAAGPPSRPTWYFFRSRASESLPPQHE